MKVKYQIPNGEILSSSPLFKTENTFCTLDTKIVYFFSRKPCEARTTDKGVKGELSVVPSCGGHVQARKKTGGVAWGKMLKFSLFSLGSRGAKNPPGGGF